MVNFKRVASLLLIMVLMVTILTPISFAEGKEISGKVDSILIERQDGKVVMVSKDEYGKMFILKTGALYNNLVTTEGKLQVVGLVSGEKFVDKNEYGRSYILNNRNIADALEAAEPIEDDVVATFYKVESVNEETGEVVLVPIFGQEPGTPSVSGTFRPVAEGQIFGFVVTEVNNVPEAAKFSVEYYIKGNEGPETRETEIYNIGEEAETVVFDVDGEHPYNTVNIKIYNNAGELLETFEGIVLEVITTASYTSTQSFTFSK